MWNTQLINRKVSKQSTENESSLYIYNDTMGWCSNLQFWGVGVISKRPMPISANEYVLVYILVKLDSWLRKNTISVGSYFFFFLFFLPFSSKGTLVWY